MALQSRVVAALLEGMIKPSASAASISVRGITTSVAGAFADTGIAPRGRPGPEDPVKDVKNAAKQTAEEARQDPASVADKTADTAKGALGWTTQFVKETAASVAGLAGQVLGNARDDTMKEMAAARHPEAANAARTETGGGSQAEQAQAAVKSGLSGFTPEEKVDEVRGLRRSVEQHEQGLPSGANTRDQLGTDPDQLRGDTLGYPPADGSTSREARMGGQPAGRVGKPPPDEVPRH